MDSKSRLDDGKILYAIENVHLYIDGSASKEIETSFCSALNLKKYESVLSSIYITNKNIIFVPSSKKRGGLAIAGLVLGGGTPIGLIGAAAGQAIANFLQKNQGDKSIPDPNGDNARYPVMEASTAIISASEYMFNWDIAGGDWDTTIKISGNCFFGGKSIDVVFSITVDGKVSEKSFLKTRNTTLDELCAALGKPIPNITRRK
jgi:hypothetical protein